MALAETKALFCRRFYRNLTEYHKLATSTNVLKSTLQSRTYCTAGTDHNSIEKDPLEYFLNEKIQKLMLAITGLKAELYFSHKKSVRMNKPKFNLLSDAELAQEMEKFENLASQELQMPPVMNPRSECTRVLSEDPDIAAGLESKMAFVDISLNIADRDRAIVIRDTDGTLRTATWEEKDRLQQSYHPFPGRKIFPPKMFEEEELEKILPERKYVYILERASVQFEPDHPSFVRVSRRIFEHVVSTNSFNDLRSTRYFGPMAFYFCWTKNIEQLLIDMMARNLLSHASMLVQLYDSVNQITRDYKDSLTVVKEFCETDSNPGHRGQLEFAIGSYEANFMKQEMQQTS